MAKYLHINRTQYAVGHGGFHHGRVALVREDQVPIFGSRNPRSFEVDGPTPQMDFHYVFDCGSESPRSLARSLAELQGRLRDDLDILFVSHLHADHVSGLDALIPSASPRTVVAPYLAPEDLAAAALRDHQKGSLSGLFLEYVEDPAAWFTSRGAGRVIFIEPAPDDGEGVPEPPGPLDPDAPDGGVFTRGEGTGDFKAELRPPRMTALGGLASVGGDGAGGGAVLAGNGSAFRMVYSIPPAAWRYGDWILLPYVHRRSKIELQAFRRSVLRTLGVSGAISDANLRKRIVRCLKDRSGRESLLAVYQAHFGSDHNAVSMSLYSGPARVPASGRGRAYQSFTSERGFRAANSPPGWLTTGDSTLKEELRRRPFLDFYRSYLPNVGTLNLPHHGSERNFHRDLLMGASGGLAVVTTIVGKERVARVKETMRRVAAEGWDICVVDHEIGHDLRHVAINQVEP